MATGKVKWFNNVKGYGFITMDNSEESTEVFVHYSKIISEGYKTLKQDQQVKFETEITPKGYHASNVVIID